MAAATTSENEIGLTTKLFGGGMVGPQYGALKIQLGELLNVSSLMIFTYRRQRFALLVLATSSSDIRSRSPKEELIP